MALMIDIEGLATTPDSVILTIAAQHFDPFGEGWYENQHYYARIDTDTQPDRAIDDSTIDWWTKQPDAAAEAFNPENRIPLKQALTEMNKHFVRAKHLWANGPVYDCAILGHAYKEHEMSIPWQYYTVRDCRTVYTLCKELNSPPVEHHALQDCRRQIIMLQDALRQLNVKEIR
jgi:hypothetical protein